MLFRSNLATFTKSTLKTFEVSRTSTMPSAAKTLSADELADLIGYLLSLKGGL